MWRKTFFAYLTFPLALKVTQSNDKDWSETNLGSQRKTTWRIWSGNFTRTNGDCVLLENSHSLAYSGTMGKEQDLIQAAKTGNVAHIEKILGHKTRKSGIQRYLGAVWNSLTGNESCLQSTDCIHVFCSLMSKTVNPNHQDELGYTPLHHAALSGHRYINYEGIYIITEFVTAFKLILFCHLLKWSIQIERSYFIRVLDRK